MSEAVRGPIRILPADMLSYIFQVGAHQIRKSSNRQNRAWARERLASSQVCQQWRSIAHGTAVLWTTLEFDERRECLDIMANWIQRSVDAPLNVVMDIDCARVNFRGYWAGVDTMTADNCADDSLRSVLELLRDHGDLRRRFVAASKHLVEAFRVVGQQSNRWQTLRFKTGDIALARYVLLYLSTLQSAPTLSQYSMELYGEEFQQNAQERDLRLSHLLPQLPASSFARATPRLCSITLRYIPILWHSRYMFTNLATLKLESHTQPARPSFQEFKMLTDNSPRLEVLSLVDSGPSDRRVTRQGVFSVQWPDEQILMPNLHTLQFARHTGQYASNLWKRLRMPALRRLTLDICHLHLEEESLQAFIQQTCASTQRIRRTNAQNLSGESVLGQLTYLHIAALSFPQHLLALFLSALVRVRTMCIESEGNLVEQLVLTVLGQRAPDIAAGTMPAILCPELHTAITKNAPANPQSMLEALRRRRSHGSPIRQIRIYRRGGRMGTQEKQYLLTHCKREVGNLEIYDDDDALFDSISDFAPV